MKITSDDLSEDVRRAWDAADAAPEGVEYPDENEKHLPQPMTGLMAEFRMLKEKKEDLANEMKAVNEALDALDPMIVDMMVDEGIAKMSLNDRTFHLRQEVQASVKADCHAKAVSAAYDFELESMIVLQPGKLKAWVKERMAEDGELPEAFAGLLNIHERYRLGMRKA